MRASPVFIPALSTAPKHRHTTRLISLLLKQPVSLIRYFGFQKPRLIDILCEKYSQKPIVSLSCCTKMPDRQCHHPDIRKFDGVRCCLACGEAVFEILKPNTSLKFDPSTPTPYEYTDLNYTLGQEIRLCVVLPAEQGDDLHCEMIHVNLEDEPDYEAVSYTWASEYGDASLSRSIRCNGNTYVPITANCEAAIRQLRKRGLKRHLWIDAICINQTKINERNHQVGLMGRIYSQAQSVRICIQIEPFLAQLFDYRSLFTWLQSESTEGVLRATSIAAALISSRYFTRVWVIQEVALARVPPTFSLTTTKFYSPKASWTD
jgi:hypothetical protein